MQTIDLIQRNAEQQPEPDRLPTTPGVPAVIVTCIDARTDPAHILGIQPGESSVFRNVGGRLTTEVITQIGMVAGLAKALRGDDIELDVALVHHNQCGASQFTDEHMQQRLAATAGTTNEAVASLGFSDPANSLGHDVDKLAASALPPGLAITAYLYDVTNGTLTEHTGRTTLGELRAG